MQDCLLKGPAPEYDIMPDGYARGYEGDSLETRTFFRTLHAVAKIARDQGKDVNGIWNAVYRWQATGSAV